MNRDQRTRDRDFTRDYDRGPKVAKRYKEDRAYNNYYGDSGRVTDARGPVQDFRTLRISNINPRVADSTLHEHLYQEFKKFGEFNIKVIYTEESRRIAFVNFKFAEDARDAKHARGRGLVLFEMPVRVEPVYNNNKKHQNKSPPYSRDSYVNRSVSPHGRRTGRGDNVERDGQSKDGDFQSFDNTGQSGGRSDGRGPREHKFPYHLHHIQPEDDDKATRTLFVGNIDHNLSEVELRQVFERFGTVEDIDIKRPSQSQGNAYAFIKFWNLDMAHRAKVNMSGQYIGNLQCKIGYGKATPTTCLWVGGLGPWVTVDTLEAEFDRFGVIHRIEWPQGKNYAYVVYDSIDAAQAACQEMRGAPLGGPERRLRIDFTDVNHTQCPTPPRSNAGTKEKDDKDQSSAVAEGVTNRSFMAQSTPSRAETVDRVDDYRNPDNPRDLELEKPRRDDGDRVSNSSWKQYRSHQDGSGYRTKGGSESHRECSPSKDKGQDQASRIDSPQAKRPRLSGDEERLSVGMDRNHNTNGNQEDRTQVQENSIFQTGEVDNVDSVSELAKCLPVVWSGALVLKNSAFLARMHLVSGDVRIVDTLMRDHTTTEMPVLKITQRLRLDQPKLEEIGRRVMTCGPKGHSVLLAMPGSTAQLDEVNASMQQRPLRNLVSYLKQKEAAGVISLPPNPCKDREVGVLHSFPPCQFSHDYLMKRAPKLKIEAGKEEHLVIVVVRGTA